MSVFFKFCYSRTDSFEKDGTLLSVLMAEGVFFRVMRSGVMPGQLRFPHTHSFLPG